MKDPGVFSQVALFTQRLKSHSLRSEKARYKCHVGSNRVPTSGIIHLFVEGQIKNKCVLGNRSENFR